MRTHDARRGIGLPRPSGIVGGRPHETEGACAMNVLIADTLEQHAVDELRAAGCNVTVDPSLHGDALRNAIVEMDCNVLLVRSTRVTKDMLDAAPSMSLVVRAGAGVNTIDVAAASDRAILVANCPGKNAVAVAELTFALILALDRRVVDNVNDLRGGRWRKKTYAKARGLKGRTLGIVGLGRIGRAVAERARAFEMHVVAWSRSLTDECAAALGVTRCEDAAAVAARCDVLSIHLAATPETTRLVDADVLQRLAPGSYVINTSRAEVLDYGALAAAARDRDIRVGLDVYPNEPGAADESFTDDIVRAGGIIYGTHHIGASTDQAQTAIAREAVRIVLTFKHTQRVENCVNLRAGERAQYLLVVRHMNRPGVLAHTLNVISRASINVEEMDNTIFAGNAAARAYITLDGKLPDDVRREIETGNEHILTVSQSAIGKQQPITDNQSARIEN